jgi:uncharacterized protein (DUF1330 family)
MEHEAMRVHGAEVRGGKVEVLEGDWNPGRTVILAFQLRGGQGLHDSPEYTRARQAWRRRRHHAAGGGRRC